MAQTSRIEWTESTWNPVTGCTKVSAGCKHCYAERLALRLKAMRKPQYINGFEVTVHDEILDVPRCWKTPRTIFVNSMSDLFHEDIPVSFVKRVFRVMNECPQHTFQVLTKRPHVAASYARFLEWSENIWMGTSVENEKTASRIDVLREIPVKVRFLSLEPLLGPIHRLSMRGIHWVIVGGESGPKARPMEVEWVREIRDCCLEKEVPFFFKQWGGMNKKKTGRKLDGRFWNQMPSMGNGNGRRSLR